MLRRVQDFSELRFHSLQNSLTLDAWDTPNSSGVKVVDCPGALSNKQS
jgi:hypothetical protein